MSVTPSSTIVGVFRDRSAAQQAVDALYNAGFRDEQIQYSVPGTSGNFFEDLKSFFRGTSDSEGNLVSDLTNMGLSDADAQYYSSEYNKGNPIVVVRAQGRESEAMNILRQYGAYKAERESGSLSETTPDTHQPGDYTPQDNYATSEQSNSAQDWETTSQSQTVEEYAFAEPQPDTITPEHDANDQSGQSSTPVNASYPQGPQVDLASPGYESRDQASQTAAGSSEQGSARAASQADVSAPDEHEDYRTGHPNSIPPEGELNSQAVSPAMTEFDTQPQAAQTTPVTPGQETEMQPSQADGVSPEQTDELQQLQTQHQTLQQELQEAKDQLQAAKEQESQLKAVRERVQQLQSTRQQIQDLQAELQATLAELQEVQSRIAQYQTSVID